MSLNINLCSSKFYINRTLFILIVAFRFASIHKFVIHWLCSLDFRMLTQLFEPSVWCLLSNVNNKMAIGSIKLINHLWLLSGSYLHILSKYLGTSSTIYLHLFPGKLIRLSKKSLIKWKCIEGYIIPDYFYVLNFTESL
jgi:hypothetical protein